MMYQGDVLLTENSNAKGENDAHSQVCVMTKGVKIRWTAYEYWYHWGAKPKRWYPLIKLVCTILAVSKLSDKSTHMIQIGSEYDTNPTVPILGALTARGTIKATRVTFDELWD